MADDIEITTAKSQRYAKWQRRKNEMRNWGGGYRKRDGMPNLNAIASFDIDRTAWREHAYRVAMAVQVLTVLFENRKIAIGNSPPHWPYQWGSWKHMTYPMIMRCLNQHINFTRDHHIPMKPPAWLPEAICLFATYEFLNVAEDDLASEEDDANHVAGQCRGPRRSVE